MNAFIHELRQINNIEELGSLISSDLCDAKQWHEFYISLPLVGLEYKNNLEFLNQSINRLTTDNKVDNTMIIEELIRDFKPKHNMVLAKDISGGYNTAGYATGELLTYEGKYFKEYCNNIANQLYKENKDYDSDLLHKYKELKRNYKKLNKKYSYLQNDYDQVVTQWLDDQVVTQWLDDDSYDSELLG